MPHIYVTQSIGRNVVAGTIKRWPRSTIDRICEEVGHSDWYEESVPHPRKRRLEELSGAKKKKEVKAA